MNQKQKIHTARFKELNKTQDQFINARITTPQTYDEIKKKGQATILKIASKGIVEKLLKRCEFYKQIINKKTETIKSKNELITLLAQRLTHYEPDLFNFEMKNQKEAVDKAKSEEVKTGLENESKTELTQQESDQAKKDNEEIEKENQEDEREPDPEPKDTEDIDDGKHESECGERGDIDDEEAEEDKEIIEGKETKK